MSWLRGFIADARAALVHWPISWVRAMSADGDGPPNWFWPSAMTGTVLGLVWCGLYFASERSAYVKEILVPFSSFTGLTFAAWLGYRGWRYWRAQKETKKTQ